MARCEDFPCCGHEAGDCPSRRRDGSEVWTCVECGKRLPRAATSSICARCQRGATRRFYETGEMWDDRGEGSFVLALVSMFLTFLLVFAILGAYHLAEVAAGSFPLK